MQIKPEPKDTSQPIQEIFNQDYRLSPQEYTPGEHDWLSEQFHRFPYRFYKYWLVIILTAELSIKDLWFPLPDLKNVGYEIRYEELGYFAIGYGMIIISLLLLSIGGGEMLFAIN